MVLEIMLWSIVFLTIGMAIYVWSLSFILIKDLFTGSTQKLLDLIKSSTIYKWIRK